MGGVYTYSRYFFHDEKYRQEENKHTSGTGQTKKGMWKEIIQSGSVYRSVCVCVLEVRTKILITIISCLDLPTD